VAPTKVGVTIAVLVLISEDNEDKVGCFDGVFLSD
jgi:hypothetical protein